MSMRANNKAEGRILEPPTEQLRNILFLENLTNCEVVKLSFFAFLAKQAIADITIWTRYESRSYPRDHPERSDQAWMISDEWSRM